MVLRPEAVLRAAARVPVAAFHKYIYILAHRSKE